MITGKENLPEKCCIRCIWHFLKEKNNAYGDVECICAHTGYVHSLQAAKADLTKYRFETMWGKDTGCDFKPLKNPEEVEIEAL